MSERNGNGNGWQITLKSGSPWLITGGAVATLTALISEEGIGASLVTTSVSGVVYVVTCGSFVLVVSLLVAINAAKERELSSVWERYERYMQNSPEAYRRLGEEQVCEIRNLREVLNGHPRGSREDPP